MRGLGLLLLTGCWQQVAVEPNAPALTPAIAAEPRQARPSSPYADVAGSWRGVGYQYDTRGSWEIELTLYKRGAVGDVIGTIAYEHGGCTANLVREDEQGGTLVMREHLVTGQGRCVDNGWVRIPRHPVAGELDWRWDFAAGTEGASSTLERE